MKHRKIVDLTQPIIVTMESFSHMKDAKLVSDDGSTFQCTLIVCDEISRNRTYYPLEDVLASMQHSSFKERLEQKVLCGECEHPVASDDNPVPLKRLMRIEPSRWSHRIDSYWVDGNIIRGTVQWCGPFGEHYRKLLVEHGSNLAMSIRAYTPNYIKKNDANGEYVIKKHLMYITTFDCVIQPGLRDARIMNPDKYAEITRNDRVTIGSVTKTSKESLTEFQFNKPIDEIRDLARCEEGMHIVSELFGIDFETAKMTITDKNTLSVSNEDGSRLNLPLTHTLLSDIL